MYIFCFRNTIQLAKDTLKPVRIVEKQIGSIGELLHQFHRINIEFQQYPIVEETLVSPSPSTRGLRSRTHSSHIIRGGSTRLCAREGMMIRAYSRGESHLHVLYAF